MRTQLSLIFVTFISLLLTGCDILNIEAAAKVLGKELDKPVQDFLVELRRVEKDASRESAEWRKLISQFRNDFKDFPSELSTETRGMVDFLLARAKENSNEIIEITDLLRKREYATALKLFLSFQKATRSKLPPVAVNISPKSTDFIWKNHDDFKLKDDRQTLVLYGYNFLRREDDKKKFSVIVRDKNDKLIRDETKHFSVSTNYIAQLDIAGVSGVRFAPGDATLAFIFDGRIIATAPITWGGERPPLPRKIIKIILWIGTSKNDKDKEITFHYTIHNTDKNNTQVGGISVGRDEVWPDDKKPMPSWRHFDIPVNDKNRFTKAERFGYKLHVRYDSYRGDPNWIGRLRAEAVLEGGEIIPILRSCPRITS